MLANLSYSLLTGEKFLGECAVVPLAPDERVAVLNFEVTAATLAEWFNRRSVPMDRVVQVDLRGRANPFHDAKQLRALGEKLRSEERRGGKECVSTCRSRGLPET